MAARWRGLFSLYIYIENCKNLFVKHHWTDFNITWQECSFGDPLPSLFKPSRFVKKTWPPGVGGGLFSRKIYKCFCQKPLDRFQHDLAEMLRWWLSTNIVQAIVIRDKKNMAARVGLIFSKYLCCKLWKLSFQEPLDRFQYNVNVAGIFFGDPLPRLFKQSWFVKKHGR